MKLDRNKIFSFMLAAVFALALAGCGGGGGGTAMTPTTPDPTAPVDPGPTPEEMEAQALKDAQDAAMAAYTAAMGAVGGAVDPVAMTNAQMYANMAKEASDAAAAATTSAMAGEYQMKAETAQASAEMAAGEAGLGLIMLANKMLNSDDIENAELDGSTPPKAVSNAANVGAAIAAAGDAAHANGFTNQGGKSGGTDNTDTQHLIAAVTDTVIAEHGASGSTFALNLTDTRLQAGEMPSRFQTKGGREAQDLLLVDSTDTTLKTHLVISTDIRATTKKDVYTQDAGDADIAADSVIAGDVPNDGSDFVASYNADPEDNNAPRTGEIYCPEAVTAGCAISVDADGKVTTVSGYKISYAKTTEDDVDGDYLAWGFWVQASIRDSIPADTTDIEAQAGAFAYGSQPFTVLSALKGTAMYNGVANGLYSAGGMVQYFDADAMLEANFGGATNTDPLGTISGSVSNIMAAGQAVDGSLALMKSNIADAGTFSGMTDGVLGGTGFRGAYGGQMYGPAARTTRAQATTFPTTAAGTFRASSQDNKMSLIGAFGAWKAE